jgi:hypothetical protein
VVYITGASGFACHSVLDNHEGAMDLAMRPTVCKVGTEADKNSVDNGVPNNHIGETGASGNRVDNGTPNKHVGETGVNGLACANEVRDYGKSSKRKRKRKQSNIILVADNHVGAKGLTRPSNWMPTVCDVGTGAVKCVDHGVPEKQVGETGENGFAGANGVPDKNCVDDKLRRQEGSKVPGSVDEKHS